MSANTIYQQISSYDEDENHMISVAKDDEEYLRKVDSILSDLDPGIDLVLYNAGTDPYPTISHATLEERERRVFQACVEKGIPCVFVLAGGYTFSQDMNSLVKSHLITIVRLTNYFAIYHKDVFRSDLFCSIYFNILILTRRKLNFNSKSLWRSCF